MEQVKEEAIQDPEGKSNKKYKSHILDGFTRDYSANSLLNFKNCVLSGSWG